MSTAEYYQEHKDDSDVWESEAEEPARRPGSRLTSMISARFEPEEVERLRAAAERAGMTQSAFVRQAVLEACAPQRTMLEAAWFSWGETTGGGDLPRELLGTTVSSPATVIGWSPGTEVGARDRRGASVLIRD